MHRSRNGSWPALLCLAALALGACKTDGGVEKSERNTAVAAPSNSAPSGAPPVTCSGEADKAKPVARAAGRKLYCAIDLGSKNAKLQVISIEPGRPLSFEDERVCKSPLGFGAKVFDQKTATKGPLPASDIANLVTVVQEFERICAVDEGTLVGADATQWARDATNIAEVVAAVKAGAAIDIEVLSAEEEGLYGYLAATRGASGRLSLDPGSNSFQLGWFEKGDTKPRTVSLPFGYVRAAAEHYSVSAPASYDAARAAHATQLIGMIDKALGALDPPSSIKSLRTAIADGRLEPVIFIAGQDGALHLAMRALLRTPEGRWIDTKEAYEARVGNEKPTAHPRFGAVTTLLTPPEFDRFFATVVKPGDYAALRQKPVRDLYGEKTLANAVLVDTLIDQLGITTVVLVPQETPAGFILGKIGER